ncbi:hypothetical protein WKW79_12080 [Variovorax robiniae]|uniref:Uncharacterized protein n=1 Tax=Variovorax robiniae TaxID=1836199 RepID=A0ABU8X6L3_9BURK
MHVAAACRPVAIALCTLTLCAMVGCGERSDDRPVEDTGTGNFRQFTLAPIMATGPVQVASADGPRQRRTPGSARLTAGAPSQAPDRAPDRSPGPSMIAAAE